MKKQFYEATYGRETNIRLLRKIKQILPLKKLKKRIVKKNVSKYIKKRKEVHLIEIGCGLGEYLFLFLKNKKITLFGTDISENAIKLAKDFTFNKPTFFQSDITKIKADNEKFDIILCMDVLEHITNDKKALKELSRILKKRGLLILSTNHSNTPNTIFYDPKTFSSEGALGGGGDLRDYSKKDLISLIKKSGFKIKKVELIAGKLTNFVRGIVHKTYRKKTGQDLEKSLTLFPKKISFKEKIGSKILYFIYLIDSFFFAKKSGRYIIVIASKNENSSNLFI